MQLHRVAAVVPADLMEKVRGKIGTPETSISDLVRLSLAQVADVPRESVKPRMGRPPTKQAQSGSTATA